MLRKINLAVDKPRNLNRIFRRRISYRNEVLAQLRLRNNLETILYSRLHTLIRVHVKRQADLLSQSRYLPNVAEAEFTENLTKLMRSHYRRVFLAIYERNTNVYRNLQQKEDAFDFSNVDFDKLVVGYIAKGKLKLEGISRTLRKKMQAIIEKGREEGQTLAQMSRDLRKAAPTLATFRAHTIARTETHNAASWANHKYHVDISDSVGLELAKKWVSVSDLRTRPAHSSANGQTVRMHEKFQVGGADMEYAGDPAGGIKNTINCRCVIVYEDPELQT